jgi:glycosyltransferase involved in cell wall biosynthesis
MDIIIKSENKLEIVNDVIKILDIVSDTKMELFIEIEPLSDYILNMELESNVFYKMTVYNKNDKIIEKNMNSRDFLNVNFFSSHSIKLKIAIDYKLNHPYPFFSFKKILLNNKSFDETKNNFNFKNSSIFIANNPNRPKLISILMSVYNTEKFIDDAITSIINQSYIYWELLIIDDNSNDNSINRIMPYLKDSRIKLFTVEKNIGPFLTKNILLKKTKGDYICFIDSDDIYHNNKLKYQLQKMQNNPNIVGIFNKFVRFKNNINNQVGEKKHETVVSFLKREVLKDIGFFDTVRFGGDTEYKNRLNIYYGNRILFDNELLYYARIREESLTKIIPKDDSKRKLYKKLFKKWAQNTPNLYVPDYLTKTDDLSRAIEGQYIKLEEDNLSSFENKNLYEIKHHKIEEIYIIHMRNSVRRIDTLKKQLGDRGLNYKIFNAIDGRLLDITKMVEGGKMDADVREIAENNRGSLGCYMSHLELWKKIYSDGIDGNYLILEDDAILNVNFNELNISKYLSFIPNNFELVYLGSGKIKGNMRNKYIVDPFAGNIKGYNSGMYGYMVKRQTIAKLISLLEHIYYPIKDPFIRMNFDIIRAYFVIDKLVGHNNDVESDRLKRDENRGRNPGGILEYKKTLVNRFFKGFS